MILNDFALRKWADCDFGINPYIPDNINPASIDLCWSGRYRIATCSGWSGVEIADTVIGILPDAFYLLDTLEYIKMPDDCCGRLYLKSTVARNGLEHLHACFIDPGFEGTLTLEVKNSAPWIVKLKPEDRIVQIVIETLSGTPDKSYKDVGHYQGQREPTIDYTDKKKRLRDEFFKTIGGDVNGY